MKLMQQTTNEESIAYENCACENESPYGRRTSRRTAPDVSRRRIAAEAAMHVTIRKRRHDRRETRLRL
jgi:hypothetical protein